MRVLSVLTTAVIIVVVVVDRGDGGVRVPTVIAIDVRACVHNTVRGVVVRVNARANSSVDVVTVVSSNFVAVAVASTASTSIGMLSIIDMAVAINGNVSDDLIAALE